MVLSADAQVLAISGRYHQAQTDEEDSVGQQSENKLTKVLILHLFLFVRKVGVGIPSAKVSASVQFIRTRIMPDHGYAQNS